MARALARRPDALAGRARGEAARRAGPRRDRDRLAHRREGGRGKEPLGRGDRDQRKVHDDRLDRRDPAAAPAVPVALAGNIGVPLSAFLSERTPRDFVCEVSSFQLEAIDRFAPARRGPDERHAGPPRPVRRLRRVRAGEGACLRDAAGGGLRGRQRGRPGRARPIETRARRVPFSRAAARRGRRLGRGRGARSGGRRRAARCSPAAGSRASRRPQRRERARRALRRRLPRGAARGDPGRPCRSFAACRTARSSSPRPAACAGSTTPRAPTSTRRRSPSRAMRPAASS